MLFSCVVSMLGSNASPEKNLRVYIVLGDTVSKLETFVWILSHISRSITWSLFTLKASYLVKWSISTWSFMWWCQFIDWLKFETRPSSLLNFGTPIDFQNWQFKGVLPSRLKIMTQSLNQHALFRLAELTFKPHNPCTQQSSLNWPSPMPSILLEKPCSCVHTLKCLPRLVIC